MTSANFGNKIRSALFISIAANIFMVAFTMGRFSAPGGQGMGPGMMHGEPPFGHHAGFMPPPDFGPPDLFSPDEMRADEAHMREDFDKMNGLRHDFAAQLEAGPVSKDDVLKHFAAMGQVMDAVKQAAQDRAAQKISTMSADDRHRLAEGLMAHGHGTPDHGGWDAPPPR